jgi:hypothetical protein
MFKGTTEVCPPTLFSDLPAVKCGTEMHTDSRNKYPDIVAFFIALTSRI